MKLKDAFKWLWDEHTQGTKATYKSTTIFQTLPMYVLLVSVTSTCKSKHSLQAFRFCPVIRTLLYFNTCLYSVLYILSFQYLQAAEEALDNAIVAIEPSSLTIHQNRIRSAASLHHTMSALANLIQPLATKLHLATLPLHAHHIIAAFLFYEFVFDFVSPILSKWLFPKTYNGLDRRGRVNWDAHVVSMVQCIIINSMALHVIFTDPAREKATQDWRERLWGYTPEAGRVQGFASGYFLWDVIVSIQHFDVMGFGSLLHGIAAFGITNLGFRPFANYYGINFVLYELSTPFLNIHWFLDKFGMTGTSAQFFNGILLLTSFFGCRLVWGIYQSYLIYSDVWNAWHAATPMATNCARFFRATNLKALMNVPMACKVLPTWLGGFYVGANSLLTVLNMYWFVKMVAAVRKRFSSKQPKSHRKNQ